MGRKGKPLDERKTGIMVRVRWKVLEYLEKEGRPNTIIEKLIEDYYGAKMAEKDVDKD